MTELPTTGALLVARQYRPSSSPTPLLTLRLEQLDRHRFDVADAAASPWPDSSVVVASVRDSGNRLEVAGHVGLAFPLVLRFTGGSMLANKQKIYNVVSTHLQNGNFSRSELI